MTAEWEFTEEPDKVDLQKLWDAAMRLPAMTSYCYIEELRKNAPKTYARLREWRISEGCTVVDWDEQDGIKVIEPRYLHKKN